MKKILILSLVVVFSTLISANATCKLEELGACKANLDNQPQTIKDKLVPNHIDQMITQQEIPQSSLLIRHN